MPLGLCAFKAILAAIDVEKKHGIGQRSDEQKDGDADNAQEASTNKDVVVGILLLVLVGRKDVDVVREGHGEDDKCEELKPYLHMERTNMWISPLAQRSPCRRLNCGRS